MGRRAYPVWDKGKTRKLHLRLLEWYRAHKRKLPWRSAPTPYRVWIAEVMLQQTQVRTVVPYYERFLSRFPDIEALASASEPEVLSHWAGLGYYRRARNLHRAAKMIVRNHGGKLPSTLEEMLELPGIGRYTAGAILSIAFKQPQPIVDGNVRRVMSRLHSLRNRVSEGFYWAQAAAWTPARRVSDFNQAIMELGALVCRQSRPQCPICPLRSMCAPREEALQGSLSLRARGRPRVVIQLVILVAQRADKVLVCRQPRDTFLPGKWVFPHRLLRPDRSALGLARRIARETLDGAVVLYGCTPVRHAITYRRIHAHVFLAELTGATGRPSRRRDIRWVDPHEFNRLITSSIFQKAFGSAHKAGALSKGRNKFS